MKNIFIIIMVAILGAVLAMGITTYQVRKKSMRDRFALEKINQSVTSLLQENLEKWKAEITGGTSELKGKAGKKGHQLNMKITVAKEHSIECTDSIMKILEANERKGWDINFEGNPVDTEVVFNLNIYTVPK